MKLERIPKYRVPLTDKSELTIERAEEGWHLTTDTGPFGSDVLYVPHAAVGLLVEALTGSDDWDAIAADGSFADKDLGSSQGASLHKAIWTYSPYRATLYRDGERFAMVTPDGSNALSTEVAAELLVALNGPDPVFDKVVDSPPIAPDPGYRMVGEEPILEGDQFKYADGRAVDVVASIGAIWKGAMNCILQRRDPDAVAAGHNPGKLTNAQVGVYDSWRLLTGEEFGLCLGTSRRYRPLQMWWKDEAAWNDGASYYVTSCQTFRTKAEKLEVES